MVGDAALAGLLKMSIVHSTEFDAIQGLKQIAPSGNVALAFANAFARQVFLPPRQFLFLSSSGIQIMTQLRPIDILF